MTLKSDLGSRSRTSWGRAAGAALVTGLIVASPLPVFSQAGARVPESVRASKPWQRLEWVYQQRAYPTGVIPADATLRALEQIERHRRRAPALRSAVKWQSVGPNPLEVRRADSFNDETAVSGRVSAVTANPKRTSEFIIGAAQGGLHLTRNNGKKWTSTDDSLPTLAIGAIAYARSNTKIVYAGTGEGSFGSNMAAGVGVLKSTNGGKKWTLVSRTDLNGISAAAIEVDPRNPNTLLMATVRSGRSQQFARQSPGVYRSTDGGVNWSRVLSGQATDLVVDAKDFNTQYAALGNIFGANENGVYRSTNAGMSWTKLSGPWPASQVGRTELAISPSNPDVLYVSMGSSKDLAFLGLFKTTDASARNGTKVATFTEIKVPAQGSGHGRKNYCDAQCWYDHVLEVDPKNPDTLYAGGIYLWKLANKQWTVLLPGHVDVHALAFSGTKLLVGTDGGIFSTADGGETFSSHNNGLALTQFYHGTIRTDGLDFMLGGTQDNGSPLRDSGVRAAKDTWTRVTGGDGSDAEVSASNPTTDWATGFQFGKINRTTDGGATYERDMDKGIGTKNRPFISVFTKCPNDDDVFVAGTDTAWRANNFFGGAKPSWKKQGKPFRGGDTIRAIAFAASDAKCNTYAVGTFEGEIHLTRNGGKKWTNIDRNNGVPRRPVTDLAFNPDDSKELWVTLSGFDENTFGSPGHVFKTSNATAASPVWLDVGPPVNLPHNAIVIQPGRTPKAWVGTDIGIWELKGSEWVHHGPSNGMPNVAVFDLQANEQGVAAFTYGRGAFTLKQAAKDGS